MTKPRFEIIKSHILKNIENGLWEPGAAVPSENQLADHFDVSRMTARRALAELTQSGVLERIKGAGTFVAVQLPTGSLLEIRNIADEITERGHRHSSRVMTLEERSTDLNSKKLLALPEGQKVFFSRVLHLENDVPIQLEERYVNSRIVPDYLEQDFTLQTPSAYLSEVTPLSEADHWIEAIGANQDLSELLEVAPSAPCLKITRRTYTRRQARKSPDVVNFAYLYHPGERYRLGGHLNF